MYRFTIIAFSFLLCNGVLTLNIDQRQTGDFNVQIDLKNFKVFALTKGKEEYVDYDYAYDYSEMTIKPQNGTTSTTVKPLNTTDTVMLLDKKNTTLTLAEFESTTRNIVINASATTPAAESVISTNASVSTDEATTVRHEVLSDIDTTTPAVNHLTDCKKGYFRNIKGICELKIQNPSNILLKMLQQKPKPSGGNGPRKP